jgi:hypothetical protein
MRIAPDVGSWYRLTGGSDAESDGELFEVVAHDPDDGTIEIQYFDGTIEEMDVEDWLAHCEDDEIEAAEAPEDWSGSVDIEPEDSASSSSDGDSDRRLGARTLDGVDLLK